MASHSGVQGEALLVLASKAGRQLTHRAQHSTLAQHHPQPPGAVRPSEQKPKERTDSPQDLSSLPSTQSIHPSQRMLFSMQRPVLQANLPGQAEREERGKRCESFSLWHFPEAHNSPSALGGLLTASTIKNSFSSERRNTRRFAGK